MWMEEIIHIHSCLSCSGLMVDFRDTDRTKRKTKKKTCMSTFHSHYDYWYDHQLTQGIGGIYICRNMHTFLKFLIWTSGHDLEVHPVLYFLSHIPKTVTWPVFLSPLLALHIQDCVWVYKYEKKNTSINLLSFSDWHFYTLFHCENLIMR